MSISKNGTCYLIESIAIHNDYNDCIAFDSRSSQLSYFTDKASQTLSNLSYIKVSSNKIRVNCSFAVASKASYCVIKNSNYENRNYFCFVNDYEYINDNCIEITFEIDVINTYLFDFTFRPCLIERTHTTTDVIGEHIEPENVDLGDYVVNTKETLGAKQSINLDTYNWIAVLAPFDGATNSVVDGNAQGCVYYTYPASNKAQLQTLINEYQEKPDSIVAIYLVPSEVVAAHSGKIDGLSGRTFSVSCSGVTTDTTIDGYKPKNKKLLTYPYNTLEIINGSGSSISCRFEFFNNIASPSFQIASCITQPVTLLLNPTSYKGTGIYELESLTISNYPMLSWQSNAFAEWCGQSATPSVMSALTSVIAGGVVAGVSGGSMAPIAISALSSATNVISQGYTASVKANNVRGNVANGSPLINNSRNHFTAYRLSITKEYAKRIDDYFTRFGYAYGKIAKVGIKNRKAFTFVKTNGCTINPNGIPSDAITKICSIFDNGVTFWREGKTVGDYSQDNTV